jgi:hypothetical protein
MAPIRPFFCPARLCERGVLVARKRRVTPQDGKWPIPEGLRPESGHLALLGIRLEIPNVIPRALIGPIPGSSGNIEMNVNRP